MSIQINIVCDECGTVLPTKCHQTMPAIRTALGEGWKVVQHEEMMCPVCIETQRIFIDAESRHG